MLALAALGTLAVLVALAEPASEGSTLTEVPEVGTTSASTTAPSGTPPTAQRTPSGREGRVFYVAPGGTDDRPGTLEEPWGTVEQALTRLRPGDTLFLRQGEYRERIQNPPIRPAEQEARIVVAAYPDERPVIRGLLWLSGADYWTLDRINVTWDGEANDRQDHMVKLTDGVGWELINAELWGAESFAALLVASSIPEQPAHWRVAGNCIHHTRPTNGTNQDHLLYINSGLESGPGIVERNLLFDAPNGAGIKLGGPDKGQGGAARVTVRYNTIVDTSQSVLIAWSSHHNTLERNLLVGVGGRYGNVRAFDLSGDANILRDTAGAGSGRLVLDDLENGSLLDGGGNRHPLPPQFDGTTSCDQFRPTNPEARKYGHLAPGDS